MQTFLPYPSFERSVRCLDYRRLGKQRVEGFQIINTLTGADEHGKYRAGWSNHPATLMWKGHVDALKLYTNQAIVAWIERGYKNTMPLYIVKNHHETKMPWWFGLPEFHDSHKVRLLQKDKEWYSQFGWDTGLLDLSGGYWWPTEHDK